MAQNTVQGNNGAIYAGNFIMQANAPLDDRTVVESKDKLLEFNNYVYNGMLVVTLDENELYQLIDVSKKSNANYEGWKKIGSGADLEDLEERLNSKADVTDVEKNELVVSSALNLLKSLIEENRRLIDLNTSSLENQLNLYEQTIEKGTNIIINKSIHNCGNYPNVTVYYDNEIAHPDIEIDDKGNLTISWSVIPTTEKPIRVVLVGRN